MAMQTQPHERQHPTALAYVVIAMVLAVITLVEVWAVYQEFLSGVLIPLLLVLSAGKFALVVMFFMHLRFDHRLYTLLFGSCLFLAVAIMVALTALFRVLYG